MNFLDNLNIHFIINRFQAQNYLELIYIHAYLIYIYIYMNCFVNKSFKIYIRSIKINIHYQ